MSDNKFIKHLRGEDTAKSVLEIKNQRTTTSFANMPDGDTSNANDVYSDHRGNATGVLKGTENWKIEDNDLVETATVYGDGRDFSNTTYEASGNTLWVDATCTFATPKRFTPNTKFVLKLCGHDLETVFNSTVDFTLIVKIGNGIISKTFTVTEQAFNFCKEFVIDFGESNSSTIKANAGSSMQVQLLCADANARAVIYNGMTIFTVLQRRVDSETVSSDILSLDEMEHSLTTHINDKNNPHEVTKAQVGLGNCDNTSDLDKPISTATQAALDGKVSTDGSSTMTGMLKMRATSSFQCAIAPFWDGVGFFKLNSDDSVTLISYVETTDGFVPGATNTYNIGSSLNKWKNLYLTGTAYITKINNGYDLLVPARSGTLATKDDVDLAANSGDQLTDEGVWYAKMYAATVAPSAEDGTNYADFSQTDQSGDPIIVLYERQNGAWVQTDTITPPAEYNGYVTVTSKIWDIVEQDGQQGGKVLWAHNAKTFTPYPQIISFEDAHLTGDSTVVMPQAPTAQSIANKDYVDTAIAAIPSGAFDLFDFKWRDSTTSNTAWALSDGNWKTNATAYQHLADDIDGKTLQSETIGSITVQFYLADDGHKICPASEESNVTAIYNATGVAWYYIIDTENQQFMLPRVSADTQVIKTEVPVDITSNGKAFIFTNGSSTYTFASNANAGFTGSANANTAIGARVNPANNGAKATGYHSGLSATADLTSATGLYAGNKYLYFYVGA